MIRRAGPRLTLLLALGAVTGCTSAGAVATASPASAAPPAITSAPAATATAIPATPAAAATASPTAAASVPAASTSGGYNDGYGGYGGYAASTAPGSPAPQGSSAAGTSLAIATIGGLGKVLTGPGGMTLYTFKPDSPGVSTCDGGCARAWPPLIATTAPAAPAGAPGEVSLITRTDGSLQVAYKGAPVYTFTGDGAAGDAKGQGSGGVWFVAAP